MLAATAVLAAADKRTANEAEKRERLIWLAAEHRFCIFEDDPYRELPFEGEMLPTMLSRDEARHTLETDDRFVILPEPL